MAVNLLSIALGVNFKCMTYQQREYLNKVEMMHLLEKAQENMSTLVNSHRTKQKITELENKTQLRLNNYIHTTLTN